MRFLTYFQELYLRIFYILCYFSTFVILSYLKKELLSYLFLQHFSELSPIIIHPLEAFHTYLLLALWSGLLITLPYLMWHFVLYLAPSLYSYELQRVIRTLLTYTIVSLLLLEGTHCYLLPLFLTELSKDTSFHIELSLLNITQWALFVYLGVIGYGFLLIALFKRSTSFLLKFRIPFMFLTLLLLSWIAPSDFHFLLFSVLLLAIYELGIYFSLWK